MNDEHPIKLATPLGDDVLKLASMTGHEQMGRLFEYDLRLISDRHDISFDEIVGQTITVKVDVGESDTRYFNGVVARFVQSSGMDGEFYSYEATVLPWLWMLTRTSNCRIFQNMSVPDIIKQVFSEKGFTDVEDELAGSYPEQEYCVQYRETDYHFVQRLMEEEGIYYYFEHTDNKHTMVLADARSAHGPIPCDGILEFHLPSEAETMSGNNIWNWVVEKQIEPGKFVYRDFDFKLPRKDLESRKEQTREHNASDYEIFDYPGEYTELTEGDRYTQTRLEEYQAQHEILRGNTDAGVVATGHTFELKEHPRDDQNREYLIIATRIHLANSSYTTGADGGAVYTNQITAIDANTPFRLERVTHKQLITGPQTAMVVGKEGEEIWTDEHGRVKVKFHWDRYSSADENSSCWIRVSQSWAGNKWGSIMLPRIGQEVIVEFLEGDPDRPIITGRVYNGISKPPYELPKNATMSTRKSLSSKDGGGFNEIRFEDKKGKEQLFMHAERRHDLRVGGSSYQTVGYDRHEIVCKNFYRHIKEDQHVLVDKNRFEKILECYHLAVDQDFGELVSGTRTIDAGDVGIAAGTIVLEGQTQICLKVAGSFITIGPAGIDIQGPMVKINSGGAAGMTPFLLVDKPEEAKAATTADPGELDNVDPNDGPPVNPPGPNNNNDDDDDDDEKTWVAFRVLDASENPVKNEKCLIKSPDGSEQEKKTDGDGYVVLEEIEEGTYQMKLPDRENAEWKFLRTEESEEPPA